VGESRGGGSKEKAKYEEVKEASKFESKYAELILNPQEKEMREGKK